MDKSDFGSLLRWTLFTPFLFENAHSGAFSSAKSNDSMRIFDAQRCKKNAGFTSSIHESMDSGFPGNTNIQLQDGSTKEICNIQIGDILLQGEKVYGLVEIKGDDLNQYKYNFGKNVFIDGGPNLTICDQKIAFVSTLYIGETNRVLKRKQESKLYHILTDTHKFHYNGVCFYDYNASIDLFLDSTRENLLYLRNV